MAGDIRSGRVIEVLAQLVSVHGAPRHLRSWTTDRSSWPTAILRWLVDAGIDTALIDPGKPWQNATDESFNGKFRDEFLNLQWFRNRMDAKVGIEQWRADASADRRRHAAEPPGSRGGPSRRASQPHRSRLEASVRPLVYDPSNSSFDAPVIWRHEHTTIHLRIGAFTTGCYSMDLRERALLDSDAGMKAADVAVKYRVSGSWVRLRKQRRRETGEVAPRGQRHGRRRMLAPHLHTLAALIAAQPDRTLAELKAALGTPASLATIWRAVAALDVTSKKNGPALRTRST